MSPEFLSDFRFGWLPGRHGRNARWWECNPSGIANDLQARQRLRFDSVGFVERVVSVQSLGAENSTIRFGHVPAGERQLNRIRVRRRSIHQRDVDRSVLRQ